MSTILFYEPESGIPTSIAQLDDALATIVGITWTAPDEDAYRPGRWRDAATGAQANIDRGDAPLLAEAPGDSADEAVYSGWRRVPMALTIPLVGPHWQAASALALIDRLLAALPTLRALDTEDTKEDPDSDSAPFPWSRPRAIASWERLREAHCAERPMPRLERSASMHLWRYRAQRAAGKKAHPERHWPDGLVVLDQLDGSAHSACFWTDASESLALPPVEYVLLRSGAIPADEVRLLAGAALPAGCMRLDPSATVDDFHRRAKPLPVERFRGLLDEEWVD